MRKPCGDGCSADERGDAEHEKADAPAEVVCKDAGGYAADEPSKRGPADIEAHDEGYSLGRPFFADVGNDYGDDAGNHDPLEETPEYELSERGGGCGEKRGDGYAEDGVDDDTLAWKAFGERSEDGSSDCDAEGRGRDGHADSGFGGVEDLREEREDRLRAVELEEGANAAKGDGGSSLGGGVVGLGGSFQGSGYKGTCCGTACASTAGVLTNVH